MAESRNVAMPLSIAIFLMDYNTEEMLYLDNSLAFLTGHSTDFIKDNFKPRSLGLWAKSDQRIYNEQIMPRLLEFLKNVPASERMKYSLCFTSRVQHHNGRLIHLLQKWFFLENASGGQPITVLGTVENIDAVINDSKMTAWVENHRTEYEGDTLCITSLGSYSTFKYEGELNKREYEVLELIAQGLPSKLIAMQLNISLKTVDRHKENIRMKTNTRNVAEMAVYAAKKGMC
ncbi:MAG: LuxR family transcriptional regulator [Sphingobacteriales bacterium]|nr:MAG: LuxR family transcriptional regulator [Sphingobacteriales bacterium]